MPVDLDCAPYRKEGAPDPLDALKAAHPDGPPIDVPEETFPEEYALLFAAFYVALADAVTRGLILEELRLFERAAMSILKEAV